MFYMCVDVPVYLQLIYDFVITLQGYSEIGFVLLKLNVNLMLCFNNNKTLNMCASSYLLLIKVSILLHIPIERGLARKMGSSGHWCF